MYVERASITRVRYVQCVALEQLKLLQPWHASRVDHGTAIYAALTLSCINQLKSVLKSRLYQLVAYLGLGNGHIRVLHGSKYPIYLQCKNTLAFMTSMLMQNAFMLKKRSSLN